MEVSNKLPELKNILIYNMENKHLEQKSCQKSSNKIRVYKRSIMYYNISMK